MYVEPRAAFDRLVPAGRHQGVVGLVAAKSYGDSDAILASAQTPGQTPLLVVLDGVEDPHNLGAILRTAGSVRGAGCVHSGTPCRGADECGGQGVSRSGGLYAGRRVSNLSRWIERLQQAGVWVYALDAEAPKVYTQLDFREPVALVFGGEGGRGAPRVRSACDDAAHIPMSGKVSSLNVSASAAIVLYEAVRQRRERKRGQAGT